MLRQLVRNDSSRFRYARSAEHEVAAHAENHIKSRDVALQRLAPKHDVSACPDQCSGRHPPWYSGLTRKHWRVLWGSYLGWIFDGYEAFALILALPPALNSLLTPEQVASSGAIYAGLAIGITLLGWGIGGLAGGVLADYFGRKRTMVIAVFFYALLTGITAFSTSLTMLIAMRFLTGLASERMEEGTRSSPNPGRQARRKAGLLQSAFGAGAVMAAGDMVLPQHVHRGKKLGSVLIGA